MKLKLILLVALAASGVSANDSAFSGIGGSLSLLKGEHSSVRMRSEKVVLTPLETGFQTVASFDFVNESSRPQTVQMGYPETNFGDVEDETKKSGFSSFVTFVEGRKTSAKRIIVRTKPNDFQQVWWVKTVRFAPREQKTIRVETVSPYGGRVDWGFQSCVSYQFTGGNWRGKVARSQLEVRLSEPGLWNTVGETLSGEKRAIWKPVVEVGKSGVTLRRTWTNWDAQAAVYIGLWKTVPFWMMEVGGNSAIVDDQVLKNVVTFRIGEKPPGLPVLGVNGVQAFLLDNTTYVSLWHLCRRLDALTPEKVKVETAYLPATREGVLRVGSNLVRFDSGGGATLFGAGGKNQKFGGPKPLFLRDEAGGQSLYVPLGLTAQILGLKIQTDLSNRRFSIAEGSGFWAAKS